MKNCEQNDYIEFEYNGETFFCLITDDNRPIRKIHGVEKMSRYANFYDSCKNSIVTGVAQYGSEEEMTNIRPILVKKWYEEYINKKSK